jgi:hypothetical protein
LRLWNPTKEEIESWLKTKELECGKITKTLE